MFLSADRNKILFSLKSKAFLLCFVAVTLFGGNLAHAASLPDFRELVKTVGPAVINISTEKNVTVQRRSPFPPDLFRGMPGIPGDPFEQFFGMMPEGEGAPTRRSNALGSGFIVSADGYIVTNYHVVKDADLIQVTLGAGSGDRPDKDTVYDAVLIGSDEETDVALIKIELKKALPLPYLKFGNSDKLEVGEWVVAIGNPFGLDNSVTAGIISAKGRNIQAGAFDSFLQTDASINPGNSGGPLLNMDGEVVGINTAIVAQGQGIGFAIPSIMAEKIIDELKNNKKVSRGWLGVHIQKIDESTAKALGLKDTKGVLLGGVIPDEPAAKAGLLAGDVIISIDAVEVKDPEALLQIIAGKKPNSKVEIRAVRNGDIKIFTATLSERNLDGNSKTSAQKDDKEGTSTVSMGIKLRALNKDDIRRFKLTDIEAGLIVTNVEPRKAADKAGLKPGDIILTAALKPVATTRDFAAIVNEVGRERGAIMLQVQRRGQKVFITVDLAPESGTKEQSPN